MLNITQKLRDELDAEKCVEEKVDLSVNACGHSHNKKGLINNKTVFLTDILTLER